MDDLRLLNETHTVTDRFQRSPLFNPIRLDRLIHRQDLVFCWFASWHSLFPILLAHRYSVPTTVIVGGYDVASIPEVGYGAQRARLSRLVSNYAIRFATQVIAMSESARREAATRLRIDASKMVVIYPGLETPPVKLVQNREHVALTVGGVKKSNLLRKGLLPFVQAAAYLPDLEFVVAGRWLDGSIETLKRVASPNVVFTGFLSESDLNALYNRASVYVQASLHEGFGLSLTESMLAGCIPVTTRVGSLPEVVSEYGIFIDSNDPAAIAEGIRKALNAPLSLREAAQKHISQTFPMQRRREALHALIRNLVDIR
jgi:glycosyltransferase involved in cell wall biosynthesis